MSLTRDQLRAARVLLHLQQTQLAEIARIGVATIRRFEGGKDIGHLYLDALRRAVVDAGVILIDGTGGTDAPAGAVGVALGPEDKLPEATRTRIAADQAQMAAVPSDRNEVGEEPSTEALEKAQHERPSTKAPKQAKTGDERPASKPRRGTTRDEVVSTGAKAKRGRSRGSGPAKA